MLNRTIVAPEYMHELLLASHQGLENLTQKLSLLVKYPVIFIDQLHFVEFSSLTEGMIDPDDILSVQFQNQKTDNPLFPCQMTINEQVKNGIGLKVKITNKALGYLLIMSGEEILTPEPYQPILSFAASLYAIFIEKKMEIKHEKLRLKQVFLYNLLYGNLNAKAEIIDYGKLWNWDFAIPYTVVVFSIKEFDFYTGDSQRKFSLLAHIEKSLLEKRIKPITLEKQEEVIVIFPGYMNGKTFNPSHLTKMASLVLEKAEETPLKGRLVCGVGKLYEKPTDIFRSYQEAKVAADIGYLLDIKIPFFSKLGLERILYKHDLQDLKEFYHHTLGSLQKYDDEHDTNLMEILEIFTFHQFDMTKTSQQLYLHRNTLRYRIKKAEEILNQQLDDVNTRLNILAAFKMKRLKKV